MLYSVNDNRTQQSGCFRGNDVKMGRAEKVEAGWRCSWSVEFGADARDFDDAREWASL